MIAETPLPTAYPPATRGRVVVTGFLASMPFGGMTWQALQHVAGFRRLGFDVWYVEESEGISLSPSTAEYSAKLDENVDYLARQLARIGMEDRWIYKFTHGDRYARGSDHELAELYRTADAVVDVCGGQSLGANGRPIRRAVMLETDPVAWQVWVADGHEGTIEALSRYDVLFTYGENLGQPDCDVPVAMFDWKPTRPPVIVDWWGGGGVTNRALTTVTSWRQTGRRDVVVDGRLLLWSKREEWLRFAEVARSAPIALELCAQHLVDEDARWGREVNQMMSDDSAIMRANGWRIVSAHGMRAPEDYRAYIRGSAGEFSISKEQVVIPRTGWFSDRSASYLAAGRPVITQETGFSKFIPTGEGLLAFSDVDEARAAIEDVSSDYERHAKAASEIAHEYFDSSKVLESVVERWDS